VGKPHRRIAVTIALLAIGALVLAAAASYGGTAPTRTATSRRALPDVGYATKQIKLFSALPRFKAPGPPVDVSSLKGKTIFNITVSSAVPFCNSVDGYMAGVARNAGLKFVEFKNQGQPSEWVQGIHQAINTHASIISLQCGILPKIIAPQIREATRAGIPVVASHYTDVSFPTPTLLKAAAFGRFLQAARLDVDYAIKDAGGKPLDVLVIYPKEIVPALQMIAAIKDEIKTHCGPQCKAKYINVPTARWATDLENEVRTALTADANVNYVIPIFDSMSLFAAPGIQAAGGAGKVKITTFNGTPPILKLIDKGNVVVMDVGENTKWLGYLNMDQIFRVLAHMKPVHKYAGPLRIIDKSNIGETGADYEGGFGTGFVSGYRKLWGLK
jgi:ribose transport system substrate-binding protein